MTTSAADYAVTPGMLIVGDSAANPDLLSVMLPDVHDRVAGAWPRHLNRPMVPRRR